MYILPSALAPKQAARAPGTHRRWQRDHSVEVHDEVIYGRAAHRARGMLRVLEVLRALPAAALVHAAGAFAERHVSTGSQHMLVKINGSLAHRAGKQPQPDGTEHLSPCRKPAWQGRSMHTTHMPSSSSKSACSSFLPPEEGVCGCCTPSGCVRATCEGHDGCCCDASGVLPGAEAAACCGAADGGRGALLSVDHHPACAGALFFQGQSSGRKPY